MGADSVIVISLTSPISAFHTFASYWGHYSKPAIIKQIVYIYALRK